MRIRVDILIPNWTKWLVAGLAMGAVLGVGAGRGYAGPVTIKTSWNSGDALSAADLNNNFKSLQDAVNQAVPPGTIIAYGGPIYANPGGQLADAGAPQHSPPPGWLLCNGDALNGLNPTYAALYAAIGTAFGGSSSSQSFNLPDLRGLFLRGVDGTAERDPDSTARTAPNSGGNIGNNVGSIQAFQVGPHGHTITDPGHVHNDGLVGFGIPLDGGWLGYQTTNNGGAIQVSVAKTGITVNPTTDHETRPINAAVNYIIRY